MKIGCYSLVALAVSAVFSTNATEVTTDNKNAADPYERIIVTGSRIQESIDEVPASVSIIDRQTITQDLLTSAELQTMLSLHVPGMGAPRGTNSNSGQTLRGRSALIMIDGVPQSTPLRNGKLGIRSLDPSVIERIEVIKGATSIYGNGAAGGIINYITKQANGDKAFSGRAVISSNFSTVKLEDTIGRRLDLAIDGTIDKLDYVFSIVSDENGVIRDADGDALGLTYGLSNFKSDNLFTKFNYYFDDTRSLQFSYNYFEGQQHSDYIAVESNVNNGTKSHAIKNTENLPIAGDPQGPRGNHNVKLQYRDMELFANTDFTADAYWQKIENVFFYHTKFKDPTLDNVIGGQSMITSEKTGLRLNFNSTFDFDNLETTLIYGVDILNDVTAQPLVDGRMWTPEMDMDNVAGYLQAKLIFAKNWVVKAGVRQESIKIGVDDYTTLMICHDGKPCSTTKDVTGGNLDYTATTYNIGLRYSNYERFSPFISYSEGFDIANIGSILRSAKTDKISNLDTEAAIVKNSEIGFSSVYQNVRFEMAAFYSTNNFGGNLVPDESLVYRLERDPQKIWGYEAAIDVTFTDELDGGVSYSWVEGKNTKSDTYLDGGSINPPKFTAYVNYQATQDLRLAANLLTVLSRDRFEAVDGKYSGKKAPVSSYSVVNASASYNVNNAFKLSAGIENLFNRDYYPHVAQSHAFTGWNIKGKGRTMNLGLTYSF